MNSWNYQSIEHQSTTNLAVVGDIRKLIRIYEFKSALPIRDMVPVWKYHRKGGLEKSFRKPFPPKEKQGIKCHCGYKPDIFTCSKVQS